MLKRMMVLVVMGLVLAALPMVVLGQAGASGSGTVVAEGDGRAGLRGSGSISLSGSGVLLIVDRAGDAVIDVSGEGTRYEQGNRVLYRGFNGTATVSGSDITVGLRGTDIALEASGSGVVRLWGTGTYEFAGESGTWGEGGVTLSLTE